MRRSRKVNGFATAHSTAQGCGGSVLVPSRRGLITGLAALIAAPALVRASSIMPVKAWVEPAVTADPMPITDNVEAFYRWFWDNMDRSLFGHPSPLPSEGWLPEARGCAPAAVSFPACSPAAVQSHQRALPMLRAWIEHIRADVKAGLTPYDSSFDEALRLVDQIDPSHRDEVR
jgi:hypothetical protein